VERTFERCFTVKVVPFEPSGLVHPFGLCLSVDHCPLLQTVVFIAPKEVYPSDLAMEDIDGSVQMLAKCITFSTGHAKEVILVVVAFNTLANLRTVNIGQDLQHFYSAKVRKNSLAKHPPTMILAASMATRVHMKHFIRAECETGTCHGVKPRILDSFLRNFAFVNNLNTLSLLLTNRNCKPVLLV
jgi:hypothetical protein